MRPLPGGLIGLCAAMLPLSGCTSASSEGVQAPRTSGTVVADASPAVWELDRSERIAQSSTSFTALVSRLDCNSGVTGAVAGPVIRFTKTKIVITFQAAAKTVGAALCPSNDLVRREVDLGEPLGGRELVDGQCLRGQPAEGTTLCDRSRWTP